MSAKTIYVVIGQTSDYEGTTTWIAAGRAYETEESANAKAARLTRLCERYSADLEKHRQSLPEDISRSDEWCRLQDEHDRKWTRIWERRDNDPDAPFKEVPSYYVQELEFYR